MTDTIETVETVVSETEVSNADVAASAAERFIAAHLGDRMVDGIDAAAKRFRKAENKAKANFLKDVVASVVLGEPITAEEYDAWFAKDVKAVLGERLTTKASVSTTATWVKVAVLATLLRPPVDADNPEGKHVFDVRRSETLEGFYERVGPLLDHASFEDAEGVERYVWPHDEAGEVVKPGRKRGTSQDAPQDAPQGDAPQGDAPQGSAGESRDQEGGLDLSRSEAVTTNAEAHARALMGTPDLGASLLKVVREHRDELLRFLTDTLKRAAEADAEAERNAAAGASLHLGGKSRRENKAA